MSRGAWAAAAVSGPVHDLVVVVTGPGAAVDARHVQAALAGRHTVSGGRPIVVGVEEPPDRRLGNLGGTLRAWREVGAANPALTAALRAGAPGLMLHDAGAASRSFPWADALDGRRGRLPLPGRLGGGTTLLSAVAALSSPLAQSNPGGILDVVWTSQLLLPDAAPGALPHPTHDLTKLCWQGGATLGEAGARELGWFGLEGGRVVAFAPAGTFADADALAAWDVPERAADVGAFRLGTPWLDALAAADLGPLDLDPGLTGPAVRGDITGPLAALWRRRGPLRVGAVALPASGTWLRLRRPAELLAAATALRGDPSLRVALDVPGDLDGVTLRGSAVRDGGGWADDVLLRDVALDAATLRGVTAVGVRGAVSAADSLLVDVAGPVHARGAVLVGCDGPLDVSGEVAAGRPTVVADLAGVPVR